MKRRLFVYPPCLIEVLGHCCVLEQYLVLRHRQYVTFVQPILVDPNHGRTHPLTFQSRTVSTTVQDHIIQYYEARHIVASLRIARNQLTLHTRRRENLRSHHFMNLQCRQRARLLRPLSYRLYALGSHICLLHVIYSHL
jgi:hypothetical protein